MWQLKKIKKFLTLPTVMVLWLAVILAGPGMLTIISEFTNWELLDSSNGYGYGYGYGYNGTQYYYGYGYGYNSWAITQPDSGNGWGGGGGGQISRGDTDTDNNVADDIDEDVVQDSLDDFLDGKNDNGNKGGNTENSPYGDEINDAYKYAYAFGITTMGDVVAALPEQGTTRAQLAKMMVQFASNALGKKMDSSRITMCSNYTDVDASLGDLKDFIIAACASKIMGLEVDEKTPLQAFDPNKLVSRWEIATVLGRLIFGNAYKNMDPYYAGYMTALMNAGIITVNDPTLMDIRANIWIMLERTHTRLAH